MARYEYKYVRVDKIRKGLVMAKLESTPYQREINFHASEGWRFVQAFAPAVSGYGMAVAVDLIFEREIQDD